MNKNLNWKIIFILIITAVAAWTLYPPQVTLKPGIDLAGGTSLVYEIDTQDMTEAEKAGLSTRMITVLRRRIDPANIQNLIWRPQGNTRFEIQMPLASAEAREKRQTFEEAVGTLLAENINPAVIMRSLDKPAAERDADFQRFSQGAPEKLKILNDLAEANRQRRELQQKRDELAGKLSVPEQIIKVAGLNLDSIKANVGIWATLNEETLKETLLEFLGSDSNLDLLTRYTKAYSDWAEVVEELINPETGKNIIYKRAVRNLDGLNLSRDRVDSVLDTEPGTTRRAQAIEKLKAEFPDRTELLDKAVAAFDDYRPFRGGLDDPKDLQRMLKGAGILEFRILPEAGQPNVDTEEIAGYVETLRTKGPKYASDEKYVWCELENVDEWKNPNTGQWNNPNITVAQFGEKYYLLTSNKREEVMLRGMEGKAWRLKKASPGRDPRSGSRAIDFVLDDRAGILFGQLTGRNIGKPLCIILDDLAISAPNINSRITTNGQITGSFTVTEVDDMVNKLNAGSLPARLIEQPLSEKTIGPSIGADNRDKGIKAGLVGLVLVVICMAAYYMLAGSIADLALLMNMLFVLAIMALVKATFTLPGIAGIILTIGMSVDANVLIFERIREEQQKGSSLRIAIKNGYERAFTTIFDANLTTFITAAILFWVASEEIKGFAIVLMLGIISSMFTALFVTRVIFDLLLSKKLIADHLTMALLIKKPNINWMALRPVFVTISAVLIIGGLFIFFTRDDTKNNKYDIEFTGGTSAQVNFKENVELTRQDVEDKIHQAGIAANNPAIAAANVYSIGETGRQYVITTTETNRAVAAVVFGSGGNKTVAEITVKIGRKLPDVLVTEQTADTFVITTSRMNVSVVRDVLEKTFTDAEITSIEVDEVVNNAILSAFEGQLEILEDLEPTITEQEKITEQTVETYPELIDFLGGFKITCRLQRAAAAAEIEQRFNDLLFKPDMQGIDWYSYKIFTADIAAPEPEEMLSGFVYASIEPEAGFRELSEDEESRFLENETAKILAAARLETSLPRVTQISPSIGAEKKTRALIAIVLSLCAIIGYIWFRFGDLRYGVAAITALVHDVSITLGAVTVCTYIAATQIGETLLIGDFKITLAIIAAFLTLIGYSLNDTIVIFDRIRENRRKAQLTAQTITESINQTLSRTILTSFTTFIVVLVMYIFGGEALRGFTFAIGFGIIIGTYSSVAIAAPILLIGKKLKQGKKK